jgi:hypothetical protein
MKRALISAVILFLFGSTPVHADFGCHFIVNARLSTALDDGSKKLSYRFTCRQGMDLTDISLYCEEAKESPGYLVSVYGDEKGYPSGDPLGSAGFVPLGRSWTTVPVGHIVLQGGTTYHLVVEQDKNRGGGHPVGLIGPNNFASFSYTDVPNHLNPTDEVPDPQQDVLVFEKGYWRALGRQPLYALHGGGFHVQGDPYESYGALPICGNMSQGEALHAHCTINPTGFAVRVKKKGNPSLPLNYRVYKNDFLHHTTTFYFGGTALQPAQVTNSFQWVTIGIKPQDHPSSFPPECTYVVFQTDSGRPIAGEPGCEDCYLLSENGNSGGLPMAAEMGFDGGPHLSRAASSTDGGKTWIDKFEWDANIVILGAACAPSTPPAIKPVPTPEPLPRDLTP